jgi:hypothetical protein
MFEMLKIEDCEADKEYAQAFEQELLRSCRLIAREFILRRRMKLSAKELSKLSAHPKVIEEARRRLSKVGTST